MNDFRRKQLAEALGMLENAKGIIETVRDEEQDSFDNMPEGLQGGERGQTMENAIDNLENAFSNIEECISCIESASE